MCVEVCVCEFIYQLLFSKKNPHLCFHVLILNTICKMAIKVDLAQYVYTQRK